MDSKQLIENEQRLRQRTREVTGYADAIAYRLQISRRERHLVWCLGSGDENSNLLALHAWIDKHLDACKQECCGDVVRALENQLVASLQNETWE